MTTVDLMPALSDTLQRDLTLRWAPSGTQIDSAKKLLEGHGPHVQVVVALILLNKSHGFWTTDVEVRPVDGAWLAPGKEHDGFWKAREAAIQAAKTALAGRDGTASWCVIRPDGSWYLFEA